VKILADWAKTGESTAVANAMSGISSLPLLLIIQIGQYLEYLELKGIRHHEFVAQLRDGGGVQGYCGGLLSVMPIACSRDETELVKNAAVAMHVALGIGAYGELGDDDDINGATTIVVRLRQVSQGEDIVSMFPGVCIFSMSFVSRETLDE
jgi:hypothetical protein